MKRVLLCVALFFCFSEALHAQATCSMADVRAAWNAGSTVTIPLGACTWDTGNMRSVSLITGGTGWTSGSKPTTCTRGGGSCGSASGATVSVCLDSGANNCAGNGTGLVTSVSAGNGGNEFYQYGDVLTLVGSGTTTTVTVVGLKWDISSKTSTIAGAGATWSGTHNACNSLTETCITLGRGLQIQMGTALFYLSGIHFYANNKNQSQDEWLYPRGHGGWKIHDNVFENDQSGYAGSSQVNNTHILIQAGTGVPQAYGIIYNNTFINGRPYIEGNIASGGTGFGSDQWVLPTGFGQDNGDTVWVENNNFPFTLSASSSGHNCVDGQFGGRMVVRFNHFSGCPMEIHGTTNGRATRAMELYANTWDDGVTGGYKLNEVIIRGGTGIIFANTFANSSWYTDIIQLQENRASGSTSGASTPYLPGCNTGPTNNLDGSGSGGYPCRDQVGTGQDAFLLNTSCIATASCPTQAVEPWPIFLNRKGAAIAAITVVSGSASYIVNGRDYQNENASFTGASGTGVGALNGTAIATAYPTCATGVYYFDTSAGSWNQGQANNARYYTNYTGQGVLHKCTSTNVWDNVTGWPMTPYNFPHTLAGGTVGPTLSSLTPAAASQGDTKAMTLTGTGFSAGGAAVNVSGTGITQNSLTVVSDTSITVNFVIAGGATTGARSVTVTTNNGTSNAQIFTVNAASSPSIISGISPATGLLGATVPFTLTGSGFSAGSASVSISGTGLTTNSVTVVSDTTITGNIVIASNASLTARTVTVTTTAGTSNGVTFRPLGIGGAGRGKLTLRGGR